MFGGPVGGGTFGVPQYNQGFMAPTGYGQPFLQNTQQTRNMEEIKRVFETLDSLLSNRLPHYLKVLTVNAEVSKGELEEHLKSEKQQVDRLRSLDDGRLEQIRRRCEEARQRNNLIMHEVLRIQEDIVQLANNEGRIQRRADCDAELYRRVSETKRILAETDRKLYEIRSVGVAKDKQPIDATEKPLKELETGVQLLSTETYKRQLELDVLAKYAYQS